MKRFLLTFIMAVFVSAAFSQTVLWRVSGKDIHSPSYLYGTIHIQDSRVFSFDSIVWRSFNSCDAIAVEFLMDEVDYEYAREKSMLSKGQSISQFLSKEDYAILDSLCKDRFGVGALFFDKMKPFFLSSAIEATYLPQEEKLALDAFFLDCARKRGMECFGLESFDSQMKVVDAIKVEDQVEALQKILHSNPGAQNDSLLSAYLDFNCERYLDSLSIDSTDYTRILLDKRNVVMYKGFRKYAKKHHLFCAVGALHLFGEKGLISLLRKKGYTVEPITVEWTRAR